MKFVHTFRSKHSSDYWQHTDWNCRYRFFLYYFILHKCVTCAWHNNCSLIMIQNWSYSYKHLRTVITCILSRTQSWNEDTSRQFLTPSICLCWCESGLSWVVGDAEELPFDDDQFDIYTIAFGIRNVTHIDQVTDPNIATDVPIKTVGSTALHL